MKNNSRLRWEKDILDFGVDSSLSRRTARQRVQSTVPFRATHHNLAFLPLSSDPLVFHGNQNFLILAYYSLKLKRPAYHISPIKILVSIIFNKKQCEGCVYY